MRRAGHKPGRHANFKEADNINAYEEKVEARKEYYEKKAAAARGDSHALWEKSRGMASQIPLGQPILVGHHSERADRAYRDRIFKTGEKAYEAGKKADYYEEKAKATGRGGISADDPDAIKKLQDKLEKLQKRQERMKAANRSIRLKDTEKGNAQLREQGYTDKQIEVLRTPNCFGRIGYAPYQLSNNNANISNVKKRIENLKKLQEAQTTPDEETDLYTYSIDDNRCQFLFDGKPEPAVRTILKQHGFKWSPSRGAWVRQATGNGIYAAGQVKKQLAEIGGHGDK